MGTLKYLIITNTRFPLGGLVVRLRFVFHYKYQKPNNVWLLHRFGTLFSLELDKKKTLIDIFGLSTGDGYTILFHMQFILVFF